MAASTGSPASRRLMKLTPLTTRPSLTSRQGMTRAFRVTAPTLPAVPLARPPSEAPAAPPRGPSPPPARRVKDGQRRVRVNPAVIERAADDRASEAGAI